MTALETPHDTSITSLLPLLQNVTYLQAQGVQLGGFEDRASTDRSHSAAGAAAAEASKRATSEATVTALQLLAAGLART